jgi:hypothetical protein
VSQRNPQGFSRYRGKAGAVDRLAANLMGHSTRRERYGDGALLAQKSAILQRIAI